MTEDLSDSARFPQGSKSPVQPLTRESLARLRLGWSSKYDHDDIDQIIRENPGLSLWSPHTGEYLIGGPWRHRSEISQVLELSGSGQAVHLLNGFADAGRAAGKRLVIASEHNESRRRAFYDVARYELIEEIIIYELSHLRSMSRIRPTLRFERLDVADDKSLQELTAVDNGAFPWLWRNSAEEFDNYVHSTGVEIYLGRDQAGLAVAYIGITRFRDWGHLDRIAVLPNLQGHGYGLQALDWAVLVLGQSGARRIGLSTQARNTRSRRLYERYGFYRVTAQDYALYGRWLGPAEPL